MMKPRKPSSTKDRAAAWISIIFHPLLIVVPTLTIAMVQEGSTLTQAIAWTALTIGVVNLPMAALVIYGVRSGRYSDASVSIREQRTSIFLVGGLCLVLLLVILIVGKAPTVIIACLVAAVLSTGISYLINRYTKLSLHSAAMAGCATVLLLTAPIVGEVMVVFAPLVAWARIRLKHHTPAQILIGWVVPMVCVIVIFRLML